MSGGRIRSVKPEWLEDELLAFASPEARVASVGLILLADDYGNGRGNTSWLRGQIFPGDDSTERTSNALRELERMRYVVFYEVEGQKYFAIRNWEKHQKVDKPGRPRVPAPPTKPQKRSRDRAGKSLESPENFREEPANPREVPENFRESLAPDLDLDQDQDRDLDQEQDQRASRAAPPATPGTETEPPDTPEKPPRRRPQRALPSDWAPLARHIENAAARGVDALAAAEKFRAHAESVDRRCANWDRAFDNWLLRERPGRTPVPPFDAFKRAQELREAGR